MLTNSEHHPLLTHPDDLGKNGGIPWHADNSNDDDNDDDDDDDYDNDDNDKDMTTMMMMMKMRSLPLTFRSAFGRHLFDMRIIAASSIVLYIVVLVFAFVLTTMLPPSTSPPLLLATGANNLQAETPSDTTDPCAVTFVCSVSLCYCTITHSIQFTSIQRLY